MLLGLDRDRLERWNGEEKRRLAFLSSRSIGLSVGVVSMTDILPCRSGVIVLTSSGSSEASRDEVSDGEWWCAYIIHKSTHVLK